MKQEQHSFDTNTLTLHMWVVYEKSRWNVNSIL